MKSVGFLLATVSLAFASVEVAFAAIIRPPTDPVDGVPVPATLVLVLVGAGLAWWINRNR